MIFGIHFRRQARVLASIAGLRRSGLAERLEAMAADLLSKADETEDCQPNPRPIGRRIACDYTNAHKH